MEIFLADSNHDIVAVRFDHFDLRDVEYVQMAAQFGQQPRLFLAGAACAALELRQQASQQGLTFVGAGIQMTRPDSRERLAKALLVERLQQIIHRAHFERLERVGVVGCDENQGGQLRRLQGARQVDAIQRIHLNVQKQQLRFLQSNGRESRGAVAELAHHAQVALGFAVFAQGAPPGGLVVHDDDIHHVPSSVVVCILLPAGASRVIGGDSRIAGMEISLIHSPP